MKYKRGDIVFASRYTYPNGLEGNRHLFIVVDVVDDKLELLTEDDLDYISLILSSQRQKGNDVSKYAFNEPLDRNSRNNLKYDSIVKCDNLFTISAEHIIMKIGEVTEEELNVFMDLLSKTLA